MTEQLSGIDHINKYLVKNPTAASRPAPLLHMFDEFCDANDDPRKSLNYRNQDPDDVRLLGALLADARSKGNDKIALGVLKILRIVSRKVSSRGIFPAGALLAVLQYVTSPKSARIAREAVSVLLNVCYEKHHVDAVIDNDGIPALVAFLAAQDVDLQAVAAGALQSICFQERGKLLVRDVGGIPALIQLLASSAPHVQARAAGAIHNLSAEVTCIPFIRAAEGLSPLILLLRSEDAAIAGSAAGAIQNLSRDVQCRDAIRELGAVEPLADLLSGGVMTTSVAAVGALLNVLGSEFGVPTADNDKRRALRRLMSMLVVLGASYHALFDKPEVGGE